MKLSSTFNHGKRRWRVAWRAGGREYRKFFKTLRSARTFAGVTAEDLKQTGQAWAALAARDRAELAQWFIRAEERGYTIPEACQYFEANGQQSSEGVTVKELCDRFISAKEAKGLRPESLRLLKVTMKQFKAGRETRRVAAVSTAEVVKFIAEHPEWGPWRRRGVVVDLHNLFGWAIRAGLLLRNPTTAIERPTIDHRVPPVLTVPQCKKLLALCRRRPHRPLLAWLAISLFAGLRAAEVSRLHWEDVKPDHIELKSHQAKGRARRLVKVRPALSAWLALCRKKSGPVCPGNHAKKQGRLRKAFGGMPKNVLRHTFISYELATSQNVDATALEAGNSADVIFRHYREVVTGVDAKEFWRLTPENSSR